MSVTVDAIYEAGVLKPLSPLLDLKEHEKVRITVEALRRSEEQLSIIEEQRANRIRIDPSVAREIGDSHEYDISES